MSTYYPIYLDLRGRHVVVIGGGAVAQQKIRGLVDAGAKVTVISPEVTPGLEDLAVEGKVEILWREYRHGDLMGAFLAFAATDDRSANADVWAEAEERGIPVNAVDDLPHCNFIAPAVHRQGDVTVTVSTSGHAPTLAVRLRDRIASWLGPEYGKLAETLGGLRSEVAALVPDFKTRTRLWYRIIDSGVIELARRNDIEGIRAKVRDVVDGRRGPGKVYLVGAGPGNPDLITVRGRDLLALADVVVYDRLVHPDLLNYVRSSAERIFVGKDPGGASAEQKDINSLLVSLAWQGRTVVRLKGGDPFVFGRGAEEAEALHRASIEFEVVPGISSAIAVPGAAGIPVTHRRFSSAFAVVAGHECEGDSDLDWSALSKIPTLVVLMGLKALPRIVARLKEEGVKLGTPAAIIANGTRENQQVVTGNLATIGDKAREAGIGSPATLVIGDVVKARELLGYVDQASTHEPAAAAAVGGAR